MYIYRGFPHSLPRPTLSEARGVGVASFPTLSISDAERRVYHNRSVSDAHNPHRTFGTMWMLICSAMPNPIFALQSLRLSSGNEQNLCNLAHCRVLWCRLSPPSRKRQGGVNRVPQALQACILVITQLASTRLPGRTEARPIGALHRHRIFDTMMMFFLTDIFAL